MDEPRLHRRTIAKGVAWSVPVITVVTTAPAIAVSPNLCSLGHAGFLVPDAESNLAGSTLTVDFTIATPSDDVLRLTSDTPTTAYPVAVDIYLDAAMAGVSFTRGPGTDPGWSNMVLVNPR